MKCPTCEGAGTVFVHQSEMSTYDLNAYREGADWPEVACPTCDGEGYVLRTLKSK